MSNVRVLESPFEADVHSGPELPPDGTMADSPSSRDLPRLKQVIASRYELQRWIARGSTAAVGEALDTILGRTVAIKFLRHDHQGDAARRALFEQEARTIARLNTPHVVQVYDYGTKVHGPWIVMERLRGEHLHQRLEKMPQLPAAMVVKLVDETARALRAAHTIGITHRNLKPRNLYFARDGQEEIVKVLDFSAATFAGVEKSTAIESPQRVHVLHEPGSNVVAARTSMRVARFLWSFAAIIYRALTGRRPGEAFRFDFATHTAKERGQTPSPIRAGLVRALDGFFERAMSPQRERRYPSINEFVDAFHEANAFDASRPRDPRVDDELHDSPTLRIAWPVRAPGVSHDGATFPVPTALLRRLQSSEMHEARRGLSSGIAHDACVDDRVDVDDSSTLELTAVRQCEVPYISSDDTPTQRTSGAAPLAVGTATAVAPPRSITDAEAWDLAAPALHRRRVMACVALAAATALLGIAMVYAR